MDPVPPRLSWQPIFYPVLSREYATEIARDWNTKDPQSGYRGHVLRFRVERAYLDEFEVHKAGARRHLEYWMPAEKLDEFNRHIVGNIEVVEEFHPPPV